MTPRVSLLVPCYNAARYLPRLFEAVRAADPPFATVLGYDDGSTDDTAAVAQRLGFALIRGGARGGVARARNELARAAPDPWLHFHDADDPIHPGFLAALGPLLTEAVDVASCDSEWLDAAQERVLLRWCPDRDLLARDPVRATLRQGISCNAMIVRQGAFAAVHGFNESLLMWEDADLHVRLAASGARYAVLNRVLAGSIRHPDSLSHDYRSSWRWRLQALESYADTLGAVYRDEIARQSEIAARELIRHGDPARAREAVALNHRLGGDAPTSRSAFMALLKRLLPAHLVLRLQEALRHRSAGSSSVTS